MRAAGRHLAGVWERERKHTRSREGSRYIRGVWPVSASIGRRETERAQRLREAQNRPDPGFANRGESRTGERPDVAGSGERGKESAQSSGPRRARASAVYATGGVRGTRVVAAAHSVISFPLGWRDTQCNQT